MLDRKRYRFASLQYSSNSLLQNDGLRHSRAYPSVRNKRNEFAVAQSSTDVSVGEYSAAPRPFSGWTVDTTTPADRMMMPMSGEPFSCGVSPSQGTSSMFGFC